MKKPLYLLLLYVFASVCLADTRLPVEIVGTNSALKNNINLTLGPVYVQDLGSYFFSSRISKAIQNGSRALGYYHSQFSYEVNGKQADKPILTITVIPGPRVVWESAAINVTGEAAELPQIRQLLSKTPFVSGKVINHGDYDEYKQQLIDTCLQLGFQNARFTHSELRVNTNSNQATAIIELQSGTRFTISTIRYHGSRLTPAVLDSLAVLSTGDWYSRSLLAQQYKSLLDTGFFASVEVKPDFDTDNGLVSIDVQLEEVKRNRYLLGGGFGTDTGPRLSFRWLKPLVNAHGHSFNSSLEVSKIQQELTARYQFPVGHPLNKFVEWGTGIQNKILSDTESLRLTTALNFHTSKNQWQRIVGINLESEKYQQGEDDAQQTSYLLPTASLSYTSLTPAADRGYRFWVNSQLSTQDLFSDTSFFRTVTGVKYLLPIGSQHSLISRLEMGVLLNDDFDSIPVSKRFFTGGDQTVRGFNYESLSPRDSAGDLTGGDRLNVASLEYRWRFKPQWALALFVDTGRAYFNSSEPFRTGAGFGGRWFSPIGQVSVDLAFPISDAEYDGFQLHISMGPPL